MWNEMLIGFGGIATGYLGLYHLGKWSVRQEVKQSVIELKETIYMLEQSKEDHTELIKSAEEKIQEVEEHFCNPKNSYYHIPPQFRNPEN